MGKCSQTIQYLCNLQEASLFFDEFLCFKFESDMSSSAPVIPMHVHREEEFKLNPVDAFCRTSPCELLKLIICSLAVGFLVTITVICINKEYSLMPLPNYGIFMLLFFCIILLAYLESLHYAVVAIQAWPMHEYANRYPRAAKLHKLVDTPAKVKKFLVGRQFLLVILFIFSTLLWVY